MIAYRQIINFNLPSQVYIISIILKYCEKLIFNKYYYNICFSKKIYEKNASDVWNIHKSESVTSQYIPICFLLFIYRYKIQA